MQRNDWDLPEPPGIKPVRGPRVWLWLAWAIVSLVLLAASLYVPIPAFFEFLPGPVSDVEKLVEVENHDTYPSDGTMLLTTVSVDTEVTVAKMVVAMFSDSRQIVLKDQVTGGGSIEDLEEQQKIEMRTSKQQAMVVVLGELGVAEPKGSGARVAQTISGFPAEGVLEEDDVITAINDQPIRTTCDVQAAIRSTEPGEEMTLVVERGSEPESITVDTVENPNEPGTSFLGVAMEEVDYEFDSDIEVSFKTGDIAGPSAGLMFSLALYDKLGPEDLTGGRTIAGTGTIGCDGEVGPIGGIEQKIAAAEDAGAEVFLAPEANFAAAQGIADDMEVISVTNFDDALAYLEESD
jgi:PDZ domain-containing protein